LVIGLGIGTAAAQPVSDALLQGQVAAASNDSNVPNMNYVGVQTDTSAKPLTNLDVNLNISVIMTIILISLLLVLISSAAGITNITKYEPIKILMERN
jgi:putative ABC transport system permease protein